LEAFEEGEEEEVFGEAERGCPLSEEGFGASYVKRGTHIRCHYGRLAAAFAG
jgi:hypothetical protein